MKSAPVILIVQHRSIGINRAIISSAVAEDAGKKLISCRNIHFDVSSKLNYNKTGMSVKHACLHHPKV